MKVNKAQLDKALKAPGGVRLFLFHGPDEAGSRALVRRLAAAAGADAERIDLGGSDLKGDPARLADEAAAISMFGSGRYVVVEPAGDETVEAAAALLGAEAAGNPVALVAGALKATSRLLKLCIADPGAIAFASYVPDERDWDRLVVELARPYGLSMRPDVAQRIAQAAGGNRAIVEQELGKYALYLGADPARPAAVDFETVEAIGAAREEGDTSALVDHVFDGDAARAQGELARLRGEGTEGITLIRAAMRRALQLARLRARVERGESPAGVIAAQGRSLWSKEKDGISHQLPAWPADRLQRCVSRLVQAENDVKNAGLGPVAADAELLAIARQARRR